MRVMDDRTIVRSLAGAIAALMLMLVPAAAAEAADLTMTGTCFSSGQQITLSGTQFTPSAPVTIAGDVTGAAQADPAGVFTAQIVAPQVAELGPRVVTLTAVDGLNPANVATLRLNVVHEPFGSNRPVAGRPRDLTTWRFAGFVPREPIYAHFLLGGRVRGDYRFGVARGDCGTLTARAARIPGVRGLAPGRWTLKLDQRMTYRASTPGSVVRFSIVRRTPASS
jgi:hypothetical protein